MFRNKNLLDKTTNLINLIYVNLEIINNLQLFLHVDKDKKKLIYYNTKTINKTIKLLLAY